MGLAELHPAALQLRGVQHQEQRAAIDLELRPLMSVVGVLDGQVMQPEQTLDLAQQLLARLVQADPDEAALAAAELRHVVDREIGDPPAILVGGAPYHHRHRRGPPPSPPPCRAAGGGGARGAGSDLPVAAALGADLMPALPALRARPTADMFSGQALPDRLLSANAYFGALPTARALDAGADIVITGRCVDSALALGPLIHEFGWAMDDHARLAAGTLAGHVIECGAQSTGGLFTDWPQGAHWGG